MRVVSARCLCLYSLAQIKVKTCQASWTPRIVRSGSLLAVNVLSALPQSTVQLNVGNSCSTTSVHAAGPHALSLCLLDGYWRHVG